MIEPLRNRLASKVCPTTLPRGRSRCRPRFIGRSGARGFTGAGAELLAAVAFFRRCFLLAAAARREQRRAPSTGGPMARRRDHPRRRRWRLDGVELSGAAELSTGAPPRGCSRGRKGLPEGHAASLPEGRYGTPAPANHRGATPVAFATY